jgi:hypothetical protein
MTVLAEVLLLIISELRNIQICANFGAKEKFLENIAL